jgi:hypothetical protein
MPIYVAEVAGGPVAAFKAQSPSAAEQIISYAIVDDLQASGLCGDESDITCREATAAEIAAWKKTFDERTLFADGAFGETCELVEIVMLVETA